MLGAMIVVLIYSLAALFLVLMWAGYIVADIRSQTKKDQPPLVGLSDDDH